MGSLVVELYNSAYCRLCGEENSNGIFIFNGRSQPENLSLVINQYLPVEIIDDGKLPRTICPSCHIQLQGTVSFFNLLSDGQKKLYNLLSTQELIRDVPDNSPKQGGSSILKSFVKGKPKTKRGPGRPRKENAVIGNLEKEIPKPEVIEDSHLTSVEELGKSRRKRKLPVRFSNSLQGKELEKVYRDVGLPEEEHQEHVQNDPEVIGKVETDKGEDLGEVMVLSSLEETNRQHMKYRCDMCNQVFTQEPKFLEHRAQHAEETDAVIESSPSKLSIKKEVCDKKSGDHECDYCDKKFRHLSSLSYHKETEHNDGRRYVCSKCDRSFKHRQLLRRHQLVHSSVRMYNCEECGACFKTKGNLMNHNIIHTGMKKYFCEICGQLFAHRTSLNLHTRWHSGEKPFECHVCNKRFTQKGNLQEHIRIHTGEKPFKCDICNRKFTTSSQCKLHLKRHSGERPWFCVMCGKSFLNKATWRCHMRRHKGEKPFDCKYCDRHFPEVWALKKHMRTHTGEKPYRCSICQKAFSDCSNLAKHKKSHFKGESGGENGEMKHVVYVSYTDPLNPSSEVSEKFVVENKDTDEEVLMQVMDEMGNPLKFTLQDGTQLQVTTRDGRSLEVRTGDGQTIPVELTTDSGEPILPELTPVILPTVADSLVDIGSIELVTTEDDQTTTLTIPQDFLQIT
ncbi:unnamed protein product [Nezara viridula]|uniref:C2H2-type domain-containing protein n=1 Tax=Nezara viridula TaxID=85310 RepID=A0A9P0H711_NEZVI|nr:unnamed protein product [Nezara viridula]